MNTQGYVKNISKFPKYALKRHFLSGSRVSLDELYREYGEKHGLKEGEEFAKWLREVKLRDESVWEIRFEPDEPKEENKVTVTAKITETSDKKINLPKGDMKAPQVKGEFTYEDVADFSVRKAREEVPKLKDVKTLKYALNVANQRPNKETLCRILRKRIEELQAVTV